MTVKLNKRLLPSKTFYFFFFSALGSIMPYMSLILKQLRLSAQQAGLLIGARPLVQCITNPFWGMVVDKTNIPKITLLVGVVGWLFTYTSVAFITDHAIQSTCQINSSEIAKNFTDVKESNLNELSLRNLSHWNSLRLLAESNESHNVSQAKSINDSVYNQLSSNFTRMIKNSSYISSNGVVSPKNDIDGPRKYLFLMLLLVIAFGNMISAPAQTMANIATLQALSNETYKYGKQRLFGSVGWGLTAFIVGVFIGLEKRRSPTTCGTKNIAYDYRPSFYVFGVMMGFAFVAAIFMKLTKADKDTRSNDSILINIRKQIDVTNAYLLATAACCGFSLGLVETFLFWHLHDLGGTQILFSLITAVNSVAEMFGFFISHYFIERFGHLNVIAVGLMSSTVQMLCYGLAKNPWLVLSVEVLKSLVVSCTWSALVSFVGVHRGSVATIQTILHAIYWGFGYASGGVIGGFFVHRYGAAVVFLTMAVVNSLDAFFLILLINKNSACLKHGGYQGLEERSEIEAITE